jgi:hypothetical protein
VYRLIYDARQFPFPDLTLPVILLLVAAGGLAFWGFARRDERRWIGMSVGQGVPEETGPASADAHPLRRARAYRRIGLRVALAAFAAAVAVGWLELTAHARFRGALDRGEYTTVEGRVFNFKQGDRGGHRDERFSVRSSGRVHTYRYRHSRPEPGFHQSHGPVHEGIRVRIADVDGAIARLEIAP